MLIHLWSLKKKTDSIEYTTKSIINLTTKTLQSITIEHNCSFSFDTFYLVISLTSDKYRIQIHERDDSLAMTYFMMYKLIHLLKNESYMLKDNANFLEINIEDLKKDFIKPKDINPYCQPDNHDSMDLLYKDYFQNNYKLQSIPELFDKMRKLNAIAIS